MGGRGKNTNKNFLHWGKQGKHIEGHNNYDPKRSPISISKKEIEELFGKHSGTGQKQGNKEIVNFHEKIGQFRNPLTGKLENTMWGKIHYDKDGGYHIVPFEPNGGSER